ncbi:MAG: adenylate/guanylate cyclase domain-containing protein [Pseudomonadota bacterium]
MTGTRRAPGPSAWSLDPVIEWVLGEGRRAPDIDDLTARLGQKLLAAGAPLWRLRLSMRTLHPLTTARTAVWERGLAASTPRASPHGLESRSGYVGSPLEVISRTGLPFRKRLSEPLTEADHNVLHELKARGATDYLGFPLPYSDGGSAILALTGDRDSGFADADLDNFETLALVLAPLIEVIHARQVSRAIAEAYLGLRTGRRVLDGSITRGDIETIEAAIFISDIRDWTGLNNRMPAVDALALANRYFDLIVDAVDGNAGEILKFMGDGVLAIFPTDSHAGDAARACQSALDASLDAVRALSDPDPPLGARFGIGLHFGKVLYGNIGARERLDFTVLGRAVNIAARIEGQCARLDRPILFSREIADRLPEQSVLAGEALLKGSETATGLYAPSEPH